MKIACILPQLVLPPSADTVDKKTAPISKAHTFLRIHPNYLVRCSRLRAARFAYLARVWVPCTYVVDARVITQVMTRIVCNA
jgi:hypothetical protein